MKNMQYRVLFDRDVRKETNKISHKVLVVLNVSLEYFTETT
jgi:hypothetical protein